MVREYKWRLKLRSYEGDAWGMLPASGVLRFLEESAVAAADDLGYGGDFHRERQSAWVIRRMALQMDGPIPCGSELEITTWISNFARVRGGREYCVRDVNTDRSVASGLAEWVYVHRETLAPMAIPVELAVDFDTPGAPLGTYDPPPVDPLPDLPEFASERTAEWSEADSMGHINNAVYADWLDDAMRTALSAQGWTVERLNEAGLQLRGEHYVLNYRRSAMPGDALTITTRITGGTGRLLAVEQAISTLEGVRVMDASTVYGWQDLAGQPTLSPPEWSPATVSSRQL